MIKDLTICVLSSLNILIFLFIGFNHDAFEKVNAYKQTDSKNFETGVSRLQENIKKQNKRLARKSPEQIYLSIPKINLLTPVNFQNNNQGLEKGAVSLTSFITPEKPGQNILFGHSSDYPWSQNPFGTVFTLLPKLEPNDEINIIRGRKTYIYKISKTEITDPNLTGLIKKTASNELVLSTCYPIGFFNKRFNVVAVPL